MKLSSTEKNQTSSASGRSTFYRDALTVLLAAWAARLIFMLAMPAHTRSFDALAWERVANELAAGENPYKAEHLLSWAPFWMQLIFVISKISTLLDVSFFRVLQCFLILVESAVVILLVKLIREVVPAARVRTLVILGISLNPAAILLICQHCNFDVIVALWLMLFMLNLLRYNQSRSEMDWLAACLFLGLGVLTKTVPLILFPLLADGFRKATASTRFLGIVFFLGPTALGMSVLYVLSPADIISRVLEYESTGGFFGVSGLLHIAGLDQLTPIYNIIFYVSLAAFLTVISVLIWRRGLPGNREIVLLATLILAALPTLGPGYGPQYLYWYLPLLVATYAFYEGRWRIVLAGFGVILASTYLVEYALVGSDGMYLLKILASNMATLHQAVSLLPTIQKCESPTGCTLIRLPLFAAFLVLLGTGFTILFRKTRADLKGDS